MITPQLNLVGQAPATPVTVGICADDYGLTPAIGEAVRALLAAGRISATSAMTPAAHWPDEGRLLRTGVPGSIGLHFTLTDLAPLIPMPRLAPGGRFPSLPSLMARAFARTIDRAEIAAELNAQLDCFEQVLGRPPDHLDGHHHVHQLPMIADVVLETITRRFGTRLLVRYCDEPLAAVRARAVAWPRAALIAQLGRRFARRGRGAGLRGNRRFSGVRSFAPDEDVARHFEAQFKHATPGLWIMCHPGAHANPAPADDPIAKAREGEFGFLMSDQFVDLLARHRVRVGTLAETSA